MRPFGRISVGHEFWAQRNRLRNFDGRFGWKADIRKSSIFNGFNQTLDAIG